MQYFGLLLHFGDRPFHLDPHFFQDIATIGGFKSGVHILFDQQYRESLRPDPPQSIDEIFHDRRSKSFVGSSRRRR